MKLLLLSTSGNVLKQEYDTIESVTLPTKDGELTIYEQHIPLISALNPGVITVRTTAHDIPELFAVGGGVIEMDGMTLTIIADMLESEKTELSIQDIQERKAAAQARMAEYKAEHGDAMNMETYIALEYEYMKEAAKEHLVESRSH